MPEPSVNFEYPEAADELEELKQRERFRGRGEGWRLLIEIISEASNPALRFAALRYLSNPDERGTAEIAQSLGVSRMTFARELKKMRAFEMLQRFT